MCKGTDQCRAAIALQPYVIGIDVARAGSDTTVISIHKSNGSFSYTRLGEELERRPGSPKQYAKQDYEVGGVIREFRESIGMSLKKMDETLGMSDISRYESGARWLTPRVVKKYNTAFGMDMSSYIKSKLAPVRLEDKKNDILVSLYTTGRLHGLYFGRKSKSKSNPIKQYIKSCMYKHRLNEDSDLIEDVYNEAFALVCKKSASEICGAFDINPSNVLAMVLRTISLKCFAIDPRYGNPHHSFVQTVMHTSSHSPNTLPVDSSEEFLQETDNYVNPGCWEPMTTNTILVHDVNNPDDSDFTDDYGFTVEEILQHLTPEETETFYGMKPFRQPRGITPKHVEEARKLLVEKILLIKTKLSAVV